jgi:hypothetical protein
MFVPRPSQANIASFCYCSINFNSALQYENCALVNIIHMYFRLNFNRGALPLAHAHNTPAASPSTHMGYSVLPPNMTLFHGFSVQILSVKVCSPGSNACAGIHSRAVAAACIRPAAAAHCSHARCVSLSCLKSRDLLFIQRLRSCERNTIL